MDEPGFESIGHRRRFGATPLSGGRVQWLAGDARPPGQADGTDVRDELLSLFGD